MRKFKIVSVALVLAALGFGCSEQPYTQQPVVSGLASNPYYNGMGPYNNYNGTYQSPYNYGVVNPFLNYNSYQSYMYPRANANAWLMFSINYRSNPGFYYNYNNNLNANTCFVRRMPTYTPDRCACVRAPCNCEEVLSEVRNKCTTTTRVSRTTSTKTTAVVLHDADTLYLTIPGADARALYERLGREEEKPTKKASEYSNVRAGTHYSCYVSGNKSKDENYFCDYDLLVTDGSLKEQYPVGAVAAAQRSGEPYTGARVTVDAASTSLANIYIRGSNAEDLYSRLSGTETDGTIMSSGAQIKAKIKMGSQVKCVKTEHTAGLVTECVITVDNTTGQAQAPSFH